MMALTQVLFLTCHVAWILGAPLSRPHIVFVLVDDWGWNDAGHHRPNSSEIVTPNVDKLVREGINLDRHYAYHYCSPSRSSLQSGRLPVHVVWVNDDPNMVNPKDPVSGFSGIPRNMTGMATKMREAGYRTHATGKWDAGMATWDHTPMGRGYETWFGYYHHANDYWTQEVASSGPQACGSLVDLWNTTAPARNRNGTGYEEEMFTNNTLNIIDRHDTSEPLFLFHAFHQIHSPLEVPAEWENRFKFIWNKDRRKYAAMVAYMDDALGKIVQKLKSKGMWENTLMVVSSDNGGPTYYVPKIGFGGASNAPLKGGKMSDWEGGVRVNAFVSGGAVPYAKRGTVLSDYIHIADWYATFCAIAGISPVDERAAKAGLPPVDGIDQSGLLVGHAAPGMGNRTEIHHSVRALTDGRWKLITGGYMDMLKKFPMGVPLIGWSDYGNGWGFQAVRDTFASFKWCGHGCLYDIVADPSERHDLAKAEPNILSRMMARLDTLNAKKFLPDRGSPDKSSCTYWGGFYGPWIDVPNHLRPIRDYEHVVV
mmetsp:Transcript_84125/g.132832  ORF Transcript_84125/g.132832 Transcript_84125/m.132832 type:complete len:538 (-) Transcript_84125:46-1659(-)